MKIDEELAAQLRHAFVRPGQDRRASIRTEIGRSLRLTYVRPMDADSRHEWIQDLRTLLFLVAVWAGIVLMIVIAGMSVFSM